MTDDSAIAVFTNKSTATLLNLHGSESWVLNPRQARKFRYLLCCRNQKGDVADALEEHGSAFLVGEIAGVQRTGETHRVRWRIVIRSYAEIRMPEIWGGRRNPVRYTTLKELGIDPEQLRFVPLTNDAEVASPTLPTAQYVRKLTIAEAKEGLAAMFGVDASAIEIVIRA